jgi:hypothetical protein
MTRATRPCWTCFQSWIPSASSLTFAPSSAATGRRRDSGEQLTFIEWHFETDPDPWIQCCAYVFGPPGSVSQRSGSGSFYHQAKIVRKTFWILLFCDFFITMYMYLQKVISRKLLLASGRSRTEIAGSEARSIGQRCGSVPKYHWSTTLLDLYIGLRIRIRTLLFSSVAFKTPTKTFVKILFCLFLTCRYIYVGLQRYQVIMKSENSSYFFVS